MMLRETCPDKIFAPFDFYIFHCTSSILGGAAYAVAPIFSYLVDSPEAVYTCEPYLRRMSFMVELPRRQCLPGSSWCQYQSFLLLLQRQPAAFRPSLFSRVLPPIQSQEPQSSISKPPMRTRTLMISMNSAGVSVVWWYSSALALCCFFKISCSVSYSALIAFMVSTSPPRSGWFVIDSIICNVLALLFAKNAHPLTMPDACTNSVQKQAESIAGKYRRILSSPCAHYFLNFFQITVFPAFPTLFCLKKSIFFGSYKWLFIYGQKIRGIYTSGKIQ
nr:MAG TPA: hypothetical protein [Caudoviricetes sp.]